MKRLPTIERVVDTLVTARHPNFRPVQWRPVEEAYQYWNLGDTPRVRMVSRNAVPLSDVYRADPDARANLPNTWRSIAAVAVHAAELKMLKESVGATSLALYRLLPESCLEMGEIQESDIIEAKDSHVSRSTRVHGMRVGLAGGQYGIGISAPEGSLVTLPISSLISYGPFTIQALGQDTSRFTGMRFS